MKEAEHAANQFLARNMKPGMGNHSIQVIQHAIKIALEMQREDYEKKIRYIYSEYEAMGVKTNWFEKRKKKKLLKEIEPRYQIPQPTIFRDQPIQRPIYNEQIEEPEPQPVPRQYPQPQQQPIQQPPIYSNPVPQQQSISQVKPEQIRQPNPQPPIETEHYVHPDLGVPPPPMENSEEAAVYPVADSGIHEAEYPHEYGRGEVEPEPVETVRSNRGKR